MSHLFYEHRPDKNVFAGFICDHPFPAHVHDAVEIVCLIEGRLEMSIAGRKYSVRPGEIALIFPSIPHSYDMVAENVHGLTMIFPPDTITEFITNFRTTLPVNPILSERDKAPEMNAIIRTLQKMSSEQSHPLRLGYLHLFLSYLFCCVELRPLTLQLQSGLSHQVLHYISQHYTEPLSLENTARALGISRIHLSHIFSQHLRINFREYINSLRIDNACVLLRNTAYSISEIVYLCGYGNPRTFHRAFLSKCGMTPSAYRAALSEPAFPSPSPNSIQ